MRISLGAGVAFLIVLGALFVPLALRYGDVDRPTVVLEVSGSDPFLVTVTFVNRAHPLSAYRAELNITNGSSPDNDIAIGPLDRSGPWGPVNATFADIDGDGLLSDGDRFSFRAKPAAAGPWTYRLLVFYIPGEVGAPPPCPCAVGRISFTA